jgi:hypothetical protein
MELRHSAGKAYPGGVLGADLSARSLYARLMAVFRRSLWRVSDGRGPSRMTAAHLVFAAPTTAYIFAAIQFEERDLIRFYGDDYRRCREQAPMPLPLRFPRRKSREIFAEKQMNAAPLQTPNITNSNIRS